MAKEIILNVKIESQGVVENLAQIEDSIAKVNKQRDELINSKATPDALVKGLEEIDLELEALNSTYDKLIKTTKSYKAAKAEEVVANDAAKASLDKAKIAAERFEKAQKNLEGITKTIAGSVGIATAALATFGVKNEEVEKALLKVQAASAFASGIKDLQEGFKSLTEASNMLNASLLKNPYVLVAAGLVALVAVFVNLENIVALVTGDISELTLAKDALNKIGVEAVKNYGKEKVALEELFKPLSDVTLSSEKKSNIISEINEKYGAYLPNLLTEKSTNEEIAAAYDLVNASLIRKSITQAKVAALEEATVKRLQELLAAEKRRQGLIAQGNKEEFIAKTINSQLKSSEDAYNANIKAINEASKALESQFGISEELGKQIDKQSEKQKTNNVEKIKSDNKVVDNTKKNADDLKKSQDEALITLQNNLNAEVEAVKKTQQDKVNLLNQEFLDGKMSYETLQAEKILLEKEANEAIIKVRDDFRLTDVEKLKIGLDNYKKLTDANQKEITAVTKANADIDINLKKGVNDFEKKTAEELADFESKLRADKLAAELKEEEDRKKRRKKETEEEKKRRLEERDAAIQFGADSLSALSTLSNIFFKNKSAKAKGNAKEEEEIARKQFKINKAFQIGQAVINGIQSVLAITSTAVDPTGISTLLRIGSQVALNAASIAQIAATKFEGGASATTPTSPTPSLGASGSIAPTNFQPTAFGTSANQQQTFGGQGGNGGGNVLRAYVSETDLTTTSRRLGGIRNASEL